MNVSHAISCDDLDENVYVLNCEAKFKRHP